ncbi:MAG: HD-like signal output (HDOD) protein [Desulforhopalus sp.]|jgi:HD-like signal output (HDOD) protein
MEVAMSEPKLFSIAQQIEAFPPMPNTVSKVMEVTNNPESSANDLVKAILPDQAMCIAVLKIANSVLYGRSKRLDSLENAVTVLGFNEIQNIILAKAAVTAFKRIPKAYRKEIDLFWDHAFTCGLAAKIIGEHINQPSGQFFIAGLLHDIGKLAMFLLLGEQYHISKWLSGFSNVTRIEEEKETFTITHDEVGGRLLKHWQFPDTLIAAVYFHHAPRSNPKQQIYSLVIQVADFLSFMYVQPETADEQTLKTVLHDLLPNFEEQWRQQNLPFEEITLESWYTWLKIDRAHGSDILDILAS